MAIVWENGAYVYQEDEGELFSRNPPSARRERDEADFRLALLNELSSIALALRGLADD